MFLKHSLAQNMWIYYSLTAIFGYLLGSIPAGYLVGRAYGIDVREHGSGNIGATNVVRVLGKKPGYFVFFCDAMKGLLAVQLGFFILKQAEWARYRSLVGNPDATHWDLPHARMVELGQHLVIAGIIAALACIIGHNFPVWLRFRGGKGVATTIGTLLGLMPLAFLVVAVVWVAAFFISRYVSLASMLAAGVLPVAVWVLGEFHLSAGGTGPMLCFSVVAAVLVWWRHRGNIQRLLNGTEPRFTRKA